jgi:iron complex outermembrane receptor protein
VGLDYDITGKWTLGGDLMYVSGQYYGGDESNQNPQLPGYATVDLHTSYQVSEHFQVYGLIDNLFNTRYDNYATFFDNSSYVGNPSFPHLTDTRTVTPGKPFAAYVGVKISY